MYFPGRSRNGNAFAREQVYYPDSRHQPKAIIGETGAREQPLATSTPRHARALPRFSGHVPQSTTPGQFISPWPTRHAPAHSSRLSRPPLPPVTERGASRRRQRRSSRLRDHSRLPRNAAKPQSRLLRDDTYSDLSVVSPMPTLDVSYTAYLTPDVLTPTLIQLQPPTTTPFQPRADDYWFDEYGEPFVQHNPLYSPCEDDGLPELTLSTYASTSPPTPPMIHAKSVFERLESVRRHLEKSSSFTPKTD